MVFKVKKEGDHVVLFTFDNKEELDKILAAKPWSFDKHLIMLQCYNKDIDLFDMKFNLVTFWVQVHDIPIRFRMRTMAEKICEAVGTVHRPTEETKIKGDGFIRVRVTIDIS